MPIPIDDEHPWWRYRPVENQGQRKLRAELRKRADAILSREGARFSNGMLNPRIVSREEARVISQAYPRVAEQQGRPGRAITGFEAYENIRKGSAETLTEPFSAKLRRNRERVGPFEAWRQFEAPSLDISGARRVTGAIGETVGKALAGRSGEGERLGLLGRSVAEAVTPSSLGVKGALEEVADPLNLLPGVGFGPDIVRGGTALLKTAKRGAESALVRAPGTVLPEAGLRLAGKPSVAGAAIPLEAHEVGARIKRFFDPQLEARFKATNKAVEDTSYKMDAIAGTRPDEYFVALARPKGLKYPDLEKMSKGLWEFTSNRIGSDTRLFFKSFDDVDQFLKTGEYKAPSIVSPLRKGPTKPLYETTPVRPPGPLPDTQALAATREERFFEGPKRLFDNAPVDQQQGILEVAGVQESQDIVKWTDLNRSDMMKVLRVLEGPQGLDVAVATERARATAQLDNLRQALKDAQDDVAQQQDWVKRIEREQPYEVSFYIPDEELRRVGRQVRPKAVATKKIVAAFEKAGIKVPEDYADRISVRGTDTEMVALADALRGTGYDVRVRQSDVAQFQREILETKTVRLRGLEEQLKQTVPEQGGVAPQRVVRPPEPSTAPPAPAPPTKPVAPVTQRVLPARGPVLPSRTWETGAERPFAFDPNSTANQGRFRLLPAKPQGKYITRQSGTPGVSYIVDTEVNAIQAVRFNKAQFPEAKAAEWWAANKGRFKFSNQAEVAGGRVGAPSPAAPLRAVEPGSVSVRRTRARVSAEKQAPPPQQGAPEAVQGEAAGVVPPSPAAAPPSPPRRPPTATGAGGVTPPSPDIPSYVEPSMMGKNVLGMKPIQAGLSKTEEIANIARRLVSKIRIRTVEANPLTSAAFKERARVKSVVDSQSGRLGTVNGSRLTRVFQPDKTGRIPSLAGVDPTIPGAPTIQDVAARLPTYWNSLSKIQRDALLAVRDNISPYHSLLDEVGVEVRARADVMEGGFYLPRGRADIEGADLPLKVGTGLGRGTKKGFERPAVFDSQAAGIEAGYAYSPIGDTLTAYARDAGNRSVDAHVTNFFKSAVDETGLPLGQTPKMRLMEQSPEIAQKMESLKVSLGKLKAYTDNLSKRQIEVIDLWSADPSFDDLDVLLEGLGTMRGGTPPKILRELRVELNKVKTAIANLRPGYAQALRRAQVTPREQGTIGLPGLQGTTFPDEIANAANVILRGEGQPTGLFSMPIRVANAFNNLYRGVRATLDNSALGIQGLLGAADDPVAYGKAVGVNIRAWGPGGDAALGRFIENFDTAAMRVGRLTSDDWARGGLRIGGAQTEFQLGAGFAPAIAKAPGIRQANRAFGYFGDALRLEWADDMLEAELRRGKTIQQLWDAGDVQRIAGIANNMTGWAEGKAFGSMGDLLLFAPRFLESRLETVVKGVASLRPGATISQRAARRSLLKMIGYGAVLTVAANEMLGNDTDFRPLIWDARRKQYTYNPNFMRVRFMGRDYSIYGTWDSLARAITVTALGRPQEALRGLGSGIVADAWDIIGDWDFNGRPVRDTPLHFAEWLLRSNLPFAAEEVPAIVGGGVKAAREGEGLRAVGAGGVLALQTLGAKSSPMTRLETIGGATPEYNAYFDIPTDTDKLKKGEPTRTKYRQQNPDVDAKLFITGQTSSLETPRNQDGVKSYKSVREAERLIRESGIDPDDIKGIKARKEDLAQAKKVGKKLERTAVDRLIAALESPASQPAPTPSTSRGLRVKPASTPAPRGLLIKPEPVGVR